jgi:hypothetical protein
MNEDARSRVQQAMNRLETPRKCDNCDSTFFYETYAREYKAQAYSRLPGGDIVTLNDQRYLILVCTCCGKVQKPVVSGVASRGGAQQRFLTVQDYGSRMYARPSKEEFETAIGTSMKQLYTQQLKELEGIKAELEDRVANLESKLAAFTGSGATESVAMETSSSSPAVAETVKTSATPTASLISGKPKHKGQHPAITPGTLDS